jgi:hypothetical protein
MANRSVMPAVDRSQPPALDLTFPRDRNHGNQDRTADVDLDDLQQPDGSISFFPQGSYFTTLDHPGFMSTTLYEVTANVVPAPEPGG